MNPPQGCPRHFRHNGDGPRMSHTVNSVTMSHTWDVVAKLPLVPRNGDNTYVHGLDPSTGSGQALISATDGSGSVAAG